MNIRDTVIKIAMQLHDTHENARPVGDVGFTGFGAILTALLDNWDANKMLTFITGLLFVITGIYRFAIGVVKDRKAGLTFWSIFRRDTPKKVTAKSTLSDIQEILNECILTGDFERAHKALHIWNQLNPDKEIEERKQV